jgi:Flp pilus assembly protein TadG
MNSSRIQRLLQSDSGQGLVETALTASLLVLLLLAAVDFGRAFYMVVELKGAAHAGAVYGSQYPTDNTGMQNVAKANASDLTSTTSANFQATADWGCECSDGTNATAESGGSCATPSCTGLNEIYYVTVTTTASYSPLVPWPGIPSTMNMSETVQMRSANY